MINSHPSLSMCFARKRPLDGIREWFGKGGSMRDSARKSRYIKPNKTAGPIHRKPLAFIGAALDPDENGSAAKCRNFSTNNQPRKGSTMNTLGTIALIAVAALLAMLRIAVAVDVTRKDVESSRCNDIEGEQ